MQSKFAYLKLVLIGAIGLSGCSGKLQFSELSTLPIHSRSITINHALCGASDSANFPVNISLSDTTLKTFTYGGHVASSTGYDIEFYSDSGLTSLLNWEIESYTETTGTLVAWVNVPNVSATADTTIYLKYGGASNSPFAGGATGTVWNSAFVGVYHLGDGVTLSTSDSSSYANNLTNNKSVTSVSGKLGGAASFTSSLKQSLTVQSPSHFPTGFATRTLCAWFKMGANQAQEILGWGANGNSLRWALYWQNDGMLYNEVCFAATTTPWTYDTNWHYYCSTLPSGTTDTTTLMYLDGVSNTVTADGGNVSSTNAEFRIGGLPTYNGDYFTGLIDEVRVSNVARSADWILTEYNNHNNPGNIGTAGFYSVGSEN